MHDQPTRGSGPSPAESDDQLQAVVLIERGRLRIPIEKSYTLDEAAAAHVDSCAGHARGRRVIVI